MLGAAVFHAAGRVRSRRLIPATLLGLFVCATACERGNEPRLPVYPVKGCVTYEGKPLSGALVIFQPARDQAGGSAKPDPGRNTQTATGRTNAQGEFALTSYLPEDGAAAGDYQVGIVNQPASKIEQGLLSTIPASKTKPAADPLRNAYADPATSTLKAHVEPGPNQLPCFELKSQGPRRGTRGRPDTR